MRTTGREGDVFVVVGNDYSAFASHDGVVTVSEFIGNESETEGWLGGHLVILGQGIGKHDRSRVDNAVINRRMALGNDIDDPAPIELTHKMRRDRGLITQPIESGKAKYEADFIVDDQLDRLSDHITGQHIGAMLLIEASRQLAIACVELEYARDEQSGAWGFVLEQLNSKFSNYAFPLPTHLVMKLSEKQRGGSQIAMAGTIEIQQAEKCICSIEMHGNIYRAELLKKLEKRRARQAVESVKREFSINAESAKRSAS